MNWALLLVILGDISKYAPLALQLIQQGKAAIDAVNQASPNLIPNLVTFIESLLPGVNGQQVVESAVNEWAKRAMTDPWNPAVPR